VSRDRRRETGRIGEALAARYLENKGYNILETNWRNRYGELDLIAERAGELVIVEVRTTRGRQYGYGFQSIGRRKQQQVRKLALAYLQSRQPQMASFRIDVISVLLSPSGVLLRFDHLEGAF
jgi:putative endonuclease